MSQALAFAHRRGYFGMESGAPYPQFCRSMLRLSIASLIFLTCTALDAAEPSGPVTSAERGYWLLVDKAYLPPDFAQGRFDGVWQQGPEPLRSQAEKASPEERRRMAFER